MSWQVVVRPETEQDIADAVVWYEDRLPGLGGDFIEEVFRVWDDLAENPLLNSRRHPRKDIRWRYPERFPFCIIYEVAEEAQTVPVIAVLHAARQEHHWQCPFGREIDVEIFAPANTIQPCRR
jgi:plasmid stabilization system protein ParE